MATVDSVLTRVRRIFPEADPQSMLDYLNEVHNELLLTLPISVDTIDVSLVASQQEYQVDANIARIWAASLVRSSNDHVALQSVDVPFLNAKEPLWRRIAAGQPARFYTWRNASDHVVGLIPKPQQSTSGSYPVLRLEVSKTAALTRGSSLPNGIRSADVYVFGVCSRYANEPNAMQFYRMRYEQALQDEVSKFHGLNVQAKPSIVPSWIPRGGVA